MSSSQKPSIFICYSHPDEYWMERLLVILKPLETERNVDVWSDVRIRGGDDWLPEIEKAIERASVAVLMVSPDFLASDFIGRKEVPEILRRREDEGLRVFPIIVQECLWKRVEWLSAMQVRPKGGERIDRGTNADKNGKLVRIAYEIDECLGEPIQDSSN